MKSQDSTLVEKVQRPSSQDINLESHLPLQDANQSGERKFSRADYLSIMEGAEFLREFETTWGEKRKSLLDELEGENEVPLSRIYALAQDLGIERRYVDRYLEMRYPSEQKKLEDLGKLNVKPTPRIVRDTYKQRILSDLSCYFPHEEYVFHHNKIMRIKKEVVTKKSLITGRTKAIIKKRKENVMQFGWYIDYVQLTFLDSAVVSACAEGIKDVRDTFSKVFHIQTLAECKYRYRVEITKDKYQEAQK